MAVLVTGASSGIGYACAVRLAAAGREVLVHGRTPERAERAAGSVRGEVVGARVVPVHADLSSLAAVRALARTVGRLDGLVNNAGLFAGNDVEHERRVSADGHELHWAVNYLAPFVLTGLVDAPVVVNVVSGMRASLRWDDPGLVDGWDRVAAYGQSKLALTMFSVELAARAPHRSVFAVNPGYVDTRLVRESFGGAVNSADSGARWVAAPLLPGFTGTSGGFLDAGEWSAPPPLAADPGARARLWALTGSQLDSTVPG